MSRVFRPFRGMFRGVPGLLVVLHTPLKELMAAPGMKQTPWYSNVHISNQNLSETTQSLARFFKHNNFPNSVKAVAVWTPRNTPLEYQGGSWGCGPSGGVFRGIVGCPEGVSGVFQGVPGCSGPVPGFTWQTSLCPRVTSSCMGNQDCNIQSW